MKISINIATGGSKVLNYANLTVLAVFAGFAMAPSTAQAVNENVWTISSGSYYVGDQVEGQGTTYHKNYSEWDSFRLNGGTMWVNPNGSISGGGRYVYDGKTTWYGDLIGNNSNTATLNIAGGTFNSAKKSSGAGRLRIGWSYNWKQDCKDGKAYVNVYSGTLTAAGPCFVGGTWIANAEPNPQGANIGHAELNIEGGTCNFGSLHLGVTCSYWGMELGDAVLKQSGGTLTVGSKFYINQMENRTWTWSGGILKAGAADLFVDRRDGEPSEGTFQGFSYTCTTEITAPDDNPAVFDTQTFANTLPAFSGTGMLKIASSASSPGVVSLSDASPSHKIYIADGNTLGLAAGDGATALTVSNELRFSGNAVIDGAVVFGDDARLVCDFAGCSDSDRPTIVATGGFTGYTRSKSGAVNSEERRVGALSEDGKTIVFIPPGMAVTVR